MNKILNDKKIPGNVVDLMPKLLVEFDNLYDINLHIYKTTKKLTVIDIRYYSKLSMDEQVRANVLHHPPMLHCKMPIPPWVLEKNEKFDINWEHNEGWNRLRLFWMGLKLKASYWTRGWAWRAIRRR